MKKFQNRKNGKKKSQNNIHSKKVPAEKKSLWIWIKSGSLIGLTWASYQLYPRINIELGEKTSDLMQQEFLVSNQSDLFPIFNQRTTVVINELCARKLGGGICSIQGGFEFMPTKYSPDSSYYGGKIEPGQLVSFDLKDMRIKRECGDWIRASLCIKMSYEFPLFIGFFPKEVGIFADRANGDTSWKFRPVCEKIEVSQEEYNKRADANAEWCKAAVQSVKP